MYLNETPKNLLQKVVLKEPHPNNFHTNSLWQCEMESGL